MDLKKLSEIRKPYVMVDKQGNLSIIYKNRVVNYKQISSLSKSETDKSNGDCCYDYEDIYGKGWNKEHEATMLKNNGFHQIGIKDEEDK